MVSDRYRMVRHKSLASIQDTRRQVELEYIRDAATIEQKLQELNAAPDVEICSACIQPIPAGKLCTHRGQQYDYYCYVSQHD